MTTATKPRRRRAKKASPPPEPEVVYALDRQSIFPHFNYEPHSGQKIIHDSPARHRLAACGRRFGKSRLGGSELVPEALLTYTMRSALEEAGHRREFWIVGPEYSDSEKEFRVLYNALRRLQVPFDRPGTYNNPDSGDMAVSLWGGAFKVHAMSAKYPNTLVGEGLSGVILAEAAKLKERVWTKYIRPTLADFRGWSILTSTPEGKNWFYHLWQRGQDPADLTWDSWRMPSWKNDIVFPDGPTDPEILDMAADMSPEKFKQEIEADFTEFVGRVFKDFDEEVHVTDLDFNPDWPLYACCDYGWTNPFVWLFLQLDPWDNVYILGEYRRTNMDINDIARELFAMPLTSKVKTFYPDPAEPGDTAVLEKKLKVQANGKTGGELKHRLEYIRQALKVKPQHGPLEMRQPGLLIDRSCHGLIFEMNEYRYPDTKEESIKNSSEEPLKKDDHGPEALGRFFRGYFGTLASEGSGGRARVRSANVTGGRKRRR